MRSVGNLERFRWETTMMIKGLERQTCEERLRPWNWDGSSGCAVLVDFKWPLSQLCTKAWHLVWVCEACVCYVTFPINTVRSCDSSHIIIWFTTGLWDQNYSTERRISQEGISREFHTSIKSYLQEAVVLLFFCLPLKTMGRNGLKPKHEGFRWYRKIRGGKHWSRSAKGIKDPISLEVFQKKIRLYLSGVAYSLNAKK